MPYEFVKFAFTAGVLAQNFHGRSDQEFYDAGLRAAENFFVNANGGIFSRPGTIYKRNLGAGPFRALRFRANTSIESDYLVLLSAGRLQLIQDNSIVHTFEEYSTDVPFSLFTDDELQTVASSQWQSQMVLTHEHHQPLLLEKTTTGWELVQESTEGNLVYPRESPPTVTSAVYISTTSNPEGVLYGISVVDENEVETPIWIYYLIEDLHEGSFVSLSWTAVVDAVAYRVYRSGAVDDGAQINLTAPLGFIGEVREPAFTDTELDPVYESQPIQYDNPFQPGTVTQVRILESGSGYGTNNAVGAIQGSGTGFAAVPVVVSNGSVVGHRLISGGRNYHTGDSVYFAGGAEPATGVVVASPLTGIFPRASVRFEQRRVYAGSTREPMSLWVSQVGAYKTFGTRRIPAASDAFKLDLEAEELNPVRYLIPVSSGMLAFTSEDIFRIYGVEGFGPTTAASTPLQFDGCANVRPLSVHGTILYLEEGGRRVRVLAPGQQIGTYQGADVSLLSNHFFQSHNQIVRWDYARKPHDVIWCVREDGSMLAFTYDQTQGVSAWTLITADAGQEPVSGALTTVNEGFDGKFRDVVVLQEFGEVDHVVYVLVERGDNVYLETFAQYDVDNIADVWGVDSGVRQTSDELFSVVTGLEHLEGWRVAVLGDGRVQPMQTVVDGMITLDESVRTATVGLPFTGYIEPLPIKSVQLPTGRLPVSEARVLAPKSIEVRAFRTVRASMKYSTDKGRTVYNFPTLPDDVREQDFLSQVSSEFVEGQPLEPDASVRIYKTGPGQVGILGFDIEVDVDPNALPIVGDLVI